ncbi:MAG: sphingosine kinase [Actinomycetales bacterium]|nr:sphingosine kinase [Actinomycetales bacterium]
MAGTVMLVANPVAGGGRAARLGSEAARQLARAGIPCELVHPTSAADTRAVVAQALGEQPRAVVACGGDGTVHAVVQELVGTATPLVVLPGGSGDDIAASLGFASGPADRTVTGLVSVVAAGRTRPVDVGVVETADGVVEVFLAVLSTGFDSSVNERANRMARLRGQRYNVAMLRELASFRPLPYRVVVDGVVHEGEGMLVSVGNGPRFGGGMLVCPDARLDDGELDLTWLGAISIPAFLGVFPRVFKGTHVTHPAVRVLRGCVLEIDAPGQVAYADGERIGPLPIAVSVRPGALQVLEGWAGPTS